MINNMLSFLILLIPLSNHVPIQVVAESSDFPASVQALAHRLHHTNYFPHSGSGLFEPIRGHTCLLLSGASVHNALKHVSESLCGL